MELEAKKKLRQHARADRELLRNSERKLFQWLHLLTAREMLKAETIATYISYGDEPNTSTLNSQLLSQKKKLVLPRMRQDKSLEWVPWNGGAENLKPQGNIQEPIGNSLAERQLATIDAVIVPALLVDRRGFRLGQGGGSYDRALKELSIFSPHVWSVALVYDGEVTSSYLPSEEHDVPVNAVATPELVLRFSNHS